MTIETCSFLAYFVISAGLIAFLLYGRRSPKREAKLDMSAQDLLHDLTRRGAAILRVEVIDPANLMLRSPRR